MQTPGPQNDSADAPPPVMQSAPGPETVIDGRRCLYFAGTGYLGLQAHPDVIRGGCEAMQKYGMASATSRSGYGNSVPTLEVEKLAAEFMGAEDSFYFISGYMGNHVLTEALETSFDVAFVDAQAHFSVHKALKLVGWPVREFRHRDPADLVAQLKLHVRPGQRPIVLSDGVFPLTGRIAPVAEYVAVLSGYEKSGLLLDDAHALGTLGARGRGTLEHLGLDKHGVNRDPELEPASGGGGGPRLFATATLSKAIGGSGGVVCGTQRFIARAKASSRYYNAASAPAHAVSGATAAALRIVMREPGLRTKLAENVRTARQGLRGLGLPIDDLPTPVIGLSLGDAANMARIQKSLADRGVIIAHIQGYSEESREGILRFAIFANHTAEMIGRLIEEISRVI